MIVLGLAKQPASPTTTFFHIYSKILAKETKVIKMTMPIAFECEKETKIEKPFISSRHEVQVIDKNNDRIW